MQEEHDNLEQKIWRYIEVMNLVWVWVIDRDGHVQPYFDEFVSFSSFHF